MTDAPAPRRVLPVLVLAAGAMTWVITSQALAPVAVMTRRVRELSSTNLDARVPVPPTEDEIALLAVTMNDMLDRLEKASVKQRQFVSDASHELRSPVASIRTQLETALRYPDDVDWPSIATTVSSASTCPVRGFVRSARRGSARPGPRGMGGSAASRPSAGTGWSSGSARPGLWCSRWTRPRSSASFRSTMIGGFLSTASR